MPYIKQEARDRLEWDYGNEEPRTPGELNYLISRMIDRYTHTQGGISYSNINEVVGVLECAKLEFYNRVASVYEGRKWDENGEVYEHCMNDLHNKEI